MKYYLKLLSLPLSLLATFLSLFIAWRLFDLPSTEILTEHINTWFDSYGLIIIFISACIEGMLLFGGYFPGVFIIFVSVASANSLSDALIRICIGTLGLMCAHLANYILGKYGWHKLLIKFGLKASIKESKEKLLKHGSSAIFGSYWLPSMSALTDTAAGILNMPFRKFFITSFTAVLFWNFLVGIIVYSIGSDALTIVTSGGMTELMIQLSIVAIWCIILLILDFRKKHPR